jgi:hypothetical protein
MNRSQTINSYANAHALLIAALQEFPREMWQWRATPETWTIHEIVCHIADSEANSYIRARRLIAEPGSPVLGYDEMRWARDLHYHERNTDEALELFRWLRGNTAKLIRTVPEATWANVVHHSDSGPMTMDQWLDIYARHIPDHIEQMRGVQAAWLKR